MKTYGTARQATDDNIIRHIRIAFCITKVTDTHSEYVIVNAFPEQQWLCERAPILRLYACVSCLTSLHCHARIQKSSLVKHLQVLAVRYTRTGTERGIAAPRLYYALASVLGEVILIPVITTRNK
jgi:hypothetical protein